MKRRLLWILLILALAVAASSGFQLFGYYQESKKTMDQTSELQLLAEGKTEDPASAGPSIRFKALKTLNPDIVGWLKVEGTVINYPVVQAKDNQFYLKRDVHLNESKYGSIFMDSASKLAPRDQNLIIYGHHMKDGQMFGGLQKFDQEAFFREHSAIQFITEHDAGRYQIIAVFKTSVYQSAANEFPYYNYKSFPDDKALEDYLTAIRSLAYYPIEANVQTSDQLITLSTCEYTLDNGRLVVVAKRVGTLQTELP